MFSRRALLRLLGLGGAAWAWPGAAHAAGPRPLKRVIFYITSHGTLHDHWAIRQGRPNLVDYQLDLASLPDDGFSPILRPLAPFKRDLIVLDGLGNPAAALAGMLNHAAGMASCQAGYTPVRPAGGLTQLAGPSLDQKLAAERSTPFRSLEWALGGQPSCHNALGLPLPWEESPVRAYKRLFPAQVGASSAAARAAQAWQGRALLDARRAVGDLLPLLSAEERAKAELHRDLLTDLEHRLQALEAIGCPAPASPDHLLDLPADDAAFAQANVDAFFDLAVTAFQCGLTEVITLRVDAVSTAAVGMPPGDLHADVAHQAHLDPAAEAAMLLHHTQHAERLARLAGLLAAIPEDGERALDHTLVVWHNELSTADHLLHTVPWVLLGGSARLATGRYHRLSTVYEYALRGEVHRLGTPINHALVTVGQAMGNHDNTAGETEFPLADGTTLPVAGPLPGVLR